MILYYLIIKIRLYSKQMLHARTMQFMLSTINAAHANVKAFRFIRALISYGRMLREVCRFLS